MTGRSTAEKQLTRILLVEDATNTRKLIGKLLETSGYHVTYATDGETAIDTLEKESFAVVLTDIVLGNVDGLEVLHAARGQSYRPVVVLLTGYGSIETSIAALRLGAYNYLIKPVQDEELLACIASAVEKYHQDRVLYQVYEKVDDSDESEDSNTSV